MGLYAPFHTPEGPSQEFVPSPLFPSQLTSSGSVLSPCASDAMIPSASWPSLTPGTGSPSPSPTPVKLVGAGPADPPSSETNYGSAPPSSFMNALSPGEQRLYGSHFRLDNTSDETFQLSGSVSSPPHQGSGFECGCWDRWERLVAPIPISRAHVHFSSPTAPPINVSPVPSSSNAVTVYVARSASPDDVAMGLGGGKNSNATGLEDSQHAGPESSPPVQGPRVSPLLVALPPTASSINVEMREALDDIAEGRSSPLSDSSVASNDDDVPLPHLHGRRKVEYDNLGQIAGDIQALANGYEDIRALIGRFLGDKVTLED